MSLDIFVVGLIEIIMKQTYSAIERVSYFISLILIIILVKGIPHIYHLISENMFKINNPSKFKKFHDTWSVLWEDQKLNSTSIFIYNGFTLFGGRKPFFILIFVARRFLFALCIVVMPILDVPDLF